MAAGVIERTTRQRRWWALDVGRYVRACRYISGFQTVVAAAKITFAMALLSTFSVALPVVAGLAAFAVYTANNLSDVEEDTLNCPDKARFVTRWSRALLTVTGLAGMTAIVLATVVAGPLGGAAVFVPAVAGVLYSVPLVPVGDVGRLKDVFLANTAVVAGAWAVPIAVLPALVAEGVGLWPTLVVGVYFFLRTFVSVEVFNIRDVAGDRASGVATLPTRLGLEDTAWTLLALDAISLGFIGLVGPAVGLSTAAVLAAVPVTVLSMGLTLTTTYCREWDLVCLAKDGEYLVLALAGVLAL